MSKHAKRLIHDEGHKRKFLVIADESQECESAIYFAASRARNTNSTLLISVVVEPGEFQHWISVEQHHREEGEEKANAILRLYGRKLKNMGFEDLPREEVVLFGEIHEELVKLINKDQDIGFLVLGASTSPQGPGQLVSWLGGNAAGEFPIPYVVVPGALDMDEIKALS